MPAARQLEPTPAPGPRPTPAVLDLAKALARLMLAEDDADAARRAAQPEPGR